MSRVGIITDSTSSIPKELVERYGIQVVPLDLVYEKRVYRDGVDFAPGEFYQLLREAKKLPTTSATSPGTYLNAYREMAQTVDSILCITLSSKLSAVFDSARGARELARELMPNLAIQVLDSGLSTMALGFVVLAAAQAAAAGKSLEEVRAAAETLLPKVNMLVLMDTLYYLAKGGRVPAAAAWAVDKLDIKPILHFDQGQVKILTRSRTRAGGIRRMLQILAEKVGKRPLHAAVMHSDEPQEAERLRQTLAERFTCVELYLGELTPVMGTHAGPGVLGVSYYAED